MKKVEGHQATYNVSSSLLDINNATEDKSNEFQNATLDDLFNSDMLPWDKISELLSPSITSKLKSICSVINWIIYLMMVILNPLTVIVRIIVSASLWKKAYTETNCNKYFVFDTKNDLNVFIHFIRLPVNELKLWV